MAAASDTGRAVDQEKTASRLSHTVGAADDGPAAAAPQAATRRSSTTRGLPSHLDQRWEHRDQADNEEPCRSVSALNITMYICVSMYATNAARWLPASLVVLRFEEAAAACAAAVAASTSSARDRRRRRHRRLVGPVFARGGRAATAHAGPEGALTC